MTAVTSANVDGFFGSGSICFAGSCSESNCPINAKCVSPTTIDCECKNGYVSDDSPSISITCLDIDECEETPCHEKAKCTNKPGSFSCSCELGFYGDGVFCSDLNECAAQQNNCHQEAECKNTNGSFTCACKIGYTGNGILCFKQS